MKIGIDARELSGHPTGVGRYLAGLLREWSQAGFGLRASGSGSAASEHELLLYSHARVGGPFAGTELRLLPGTGGTAWEQVTLRRALARDGIDVLFSPGYTAPLLTKVPSVVAVHDVSFAAHPEWFTPREGMRRRFLCRRAARRARAVITISEFSRGEIVKHLGVENRQVHVIPPGVDRPAVAGPRSEPRLLFVGSIFNRRRVPDLIAAFGRVAERHRDASLDLVGDNRTFPHEDLQALIGQHGLDGRVRWRSYVSEDELTGLYGSARGFAFLSEYEGLGLTPLEALSVEVPAVLLDTPIARESCGPAALYVGHGDVAGTANAIEALLFDDSIRRQLLAAAPAVLARYSWPEAARATWRVIESAAS